jgi:hypothetical protein
MTRDCLSVCSPEPLQQRQSMCIRISTQHKIVFILNVACRHAAMRRLQNRQLHNGRYNVASRKQQWFLAEFIPCRTSPTPPPSLVTPQRSPRKPTVRTNIMADHQAGCI